MKLAVLALVLVATPPDLAVARQKSGHGVTAPSLQNDRHEAMSSHVQTKAPAHAPIARSAPPLHAKEMLLMVAQNPNITKTAKSPSQNDTSRNTSTQTATNSTDSGDGANADDGESTRADGEEAASGTASSDGEKHAEHMFPVTIEHKDEIFVNNGTCKASCSPSRAKLMDGWTWLSGQTHGNLGFTMKLESMNPNILSSIAWEIADNGNGTKCSVIPRISSGSCARVRLKKICRGSGTAVVHVKVSHPDKTHVPVHFFVTTVCNEEGNTEGCDDVDCGYHGICVGGKCDCEKGYNGALCELSVFDDCPGKCSGRGKACKEGVCLCRPGFSGPQCDIPSGCSHLAFCSGHGECIADAVCACDKGWTGRNCDEEAATDRFCATNSFCKDHGRCTSSGGEYVCECDAGYDGVDCGQVKATGDGVCLNHCSGHGFCNDGSCECHFGYSGEDCSQAHSPCQGCMQGECVERVDGEPKCACDETWTGKHCSIYDHSGDPCRHTGFCSGQGSCGDGGKCECAAGFTGSTCDKVEEAGCIGFCHGFGMCDVLTDKCKCDAGRGGVDCKNTLCPSSDASTCSSHGICTVTSEKSYVCSCQDPYFGSACQNAKCNATTLCSGHGSCLKSSGLAADICNCTDGWTGATCTQSIAPAIALKKVVERDIYEDSEWDANF